MSVELRVAPEGARHILFIGHLPPVRGGAKTASALLIRALVDAGYRVTVVNPVPEYLVAEVDDERDFPGAAIRRFEMPTVVSFSGLSQ